ncbi:hypothetical protein [Phenylobacterium sp.]|uniref:hypothetical protein n=1 Tax=Phenylobacterium sp. TaxID=1871053 RepID=UPI003BA996E8
MDLRYLLFVAAMALNACERPQSSDDRICATPPSLEASANAPTKQGVATGCLHRWSYRLARDGTATAETVARAAVGQCLDAIDVVAVTTNDTLERQMKVYETVALGFVVQARAGNCGVP